MAKLLISNSENISFKDYIKLYAIYEDYIYDLCVKPFFQELVKILKDFEIVDFIYYKEGMSNLKFRIKVRNIATGLYDSLFAYYERDEKRYRVFEYGYIDIKIKNELAHLFNNGLLVKKFFGYFKEYEDVKTFGGKEKKYSLLIDMNVQDNQCLIGGRKFLRLRIFKDNNNYKNVYYDLKRDIIVEKNENGIMPVSDVFRRQLFEIVPDFSFRDIPSDIKKMIKIRGVMVARKKGTEDWNCNKLNLFHQVFGDCFNLESAYVLEYSDCLFQGDKMVNGVIDGIKYVLTNLKENGIVLNSLQKIKIPDKVFFREISEEKKIIDDFFNDRDIIKNCDLSEVDFTNAVLEGVNLEDSGANIVLSKVYGRSIRNANLKGVELYGQDLEGIIADKADLRNTGVVVMVDKTSVKGAKFSVGTVFMLNNMILNEEVVRGMGIELYREEEIKLELLMR